MNRTRWQVEDFEKKIASLETAVQSDDLSPETKQNMSKLVDSLKKDLREFSGKSS
jgi:hypothetical protein